MHWYVRGSSMVRRLLFFPAVMLAAAVFSRPGNALAAEGTSEESARLSIDYRGWEGERPSRFNHRLTRPIRSGNNNFLHEMVLVPPIEDFRLVDRDRFAFDSGLEVLRETRTEKDSNRFDASYFESETRIAYGLTREFEIRIGFEFGYLRPDSRESIALTQEGEEVTPPDGVETRPGLGHVTVGLKIFSGYMRKEHLGLSSILTLKVPVGKREYLDTGRGDFSIMFAGSARFEIADRYLFVHANAGVTFFDEENVFARKVYLNSIPVYGMALLLPFEANETFVRLPLALSVWMQGNGNAFKKMDDLDSDPVTIHGGLKAMAGPWSFEAGAGFGLTRSASADFIADLSVGRDF